MYPLLGTLFLVEHSGFQHSITVMDIFILHVYYMSVHSFFAKMKSTQIFGLPNPNKIRTKCPNQAIFVLYLVKWAPCLDRWLFAQITILLQLTKIPNLLDSNLTYCSVLADNTDQPDGTLWSAKLQKQQANPNHWKVPSKWLKQPESWQDYSLHFSILVQNFVWFLVCFLESN